MLRRIAIVLLAALLGVLGATAFSGIVRRQGNCVYVRVPRTEDSPAVRVRLAWKDEGIVRVTATPERRFSRRRSLMVVPQAGYKRFTLRRTGKQIVAESPVLRVVVDRATGAVRFLDPSCREILSERAGGRDFTPVEVEGKRAYSVRQEFESPGDEAIYGLGQQQSLEFNHKGGDEELFQYNTKISVPFVWSTRGYGVLWDSNSLSRYGNPAPWRQLHRVLKLYDKDGVPGALTGTYVPQRGQPLVQREDSLYYENERMVSLLPRMRLKGAEVTYEGFVEAPETGEYRFILYYAGSQRVWIGGEEVVTERWRPAWNPNSYKFSVRLEKGVRTPVRVSWKPDGDVSYIGLRVADLRSAEEQERLSFWSEMNPEIDYYFIAGDDADEIIAGYRKLTGKAQVMPRWALGFWQSRERYATQRELVETLAEFRRRGIPVDNIVQDWQYWLPDQWGSHEFDAARYPDPEAMLDSVHAMHGRFMISVWPKFYTNTDNYKELKDAGYMYLHAEQDSLKDWLGHYQSFYDAYADGGRKMFWRQMDDRLYSRFGRKIDAWWMDASEPNLRDCLPEDYFKWLLTPTALGPSTEYYNAYALVNAQAIYEGQRGVDPDKRVFLLTRNGFGGLQRYSTASWSGDIGTTWLDMRAQMAAGLNYSMSGIPFWGMDIGGFSVEDRFAAAQRVYDATGRETEDLREWRELQTRWHQFGAFVPLFRAHGQWPRREIWNIAPEGSEAYESILYYMRLRYRLMPYLYSLAGAVHFDDYTIMRGLPMDFPDDRTVWEIDDQWLLGPALMPAPVTEYGARSRRLYFPKGAWYDFYTGMYFDSESRPLVESDGWAEVDAPYGRMPLYVRAGSILPVGPDMQWSDEKPADPIRLFVYAGADGKFVLYEDGDVDYGYERGACAMIPLEYDDEACTLRIGARRGAFPGMLQTRRFIVVPVSADHPVASDSEAEGIAVEYSGSELTVPLRGK